MHPKSAELIRKTLIMCALPFWPGFFLLILPSGRELSIGVNCALELFAIENIALHTASGLAARTGVEPVFQP